MYKVRCPCFFRTGRREDGRKHKSAGRNSVAAKLTEKTETGVKSAVGSYVKGGMKVYGPLLLGAGAALIVGTENWSRKATMQL